MVCETPSEAIIAISGGVVSPRIGSGQGMLDNIALHRPPATGVPLHV
jgi:hypothetical protein